MKEVKNSTRSLTVETTDDGSTTLFVKELDEHYHSIKGALTESQHIYRDCAFLHHPASKRIRLLEIGFGTGLNAVVTAMVTDSTHPVHYFSLEKYPIDSDTLSRLQYETQVNDTLFQSIHEAQWNTPVEITPYFTLEKRECDYLSDELPNDIDVVYFDAFAPEKQPEMWSREAFERLYSKMNKGAILTTYCAKGNIRRMLTDIGFFVERINGPIGGKREILRATKH